MTDFSCLPIWSGAVKENCGGEEKRKATFWERVFAVMLVPRGIMLGKVYLMLSHRFIEVEWVWQQRRPGKEDSEKGPFLIYFVRGVNLNPMLSTE